MQFVPKWIDFPHKIYKEMGNSSHEQDRARDWMDKVNKAKFQGDSDPGKVLWIAEVNSPGKKILRMLNPWIVTNR